MKCMVQLGIAYPQKAIATALCPAIPSVKASEFGWRFATAIKKKRICCSQAICFLWFTKRKERKKKSFQQSIERKMQK